MTENRITKLFGIQYPIIQGGMVWCSGWRLAAAVSNAGGLGLLGAGSMHPETLVEHIHKLSVAKALTILGKAILRESLAGPYGVNLLAQHVHTDVLRVLTECLHLLVRLLGREITVHLTIDEVNLDVRI